MPTSATRQPLSSQLTRMLQQREIYQYGTHSGPLSIPDLLLIACLALAPLCFLSVRSWTNLFVLFLILLAAWQLAGTKASFTVLRGNKSALWIIGAMTSPLAAVAIGELIRTQLQTTLLDGPSRCFLAGLLFIYLLQKQIDFVRLLEWVAPVSLFILGCLLWLHPYAYSAATIGRFGTVAVDPLSLGQYATLFGFICLYTLNLYGDDHLTLKIFKLLGILVALWISIGTASRSGWVAIPLLLAIWVVCVRRIRNPSRLLLALLIFILCGIAIYTWTPIVHDRIAVAASDYSAYFTQKNRDTPAGLRIAMLKMAGLLFLENPLSGYGDINYPALASIPSIASFNTEALEFALIHNGVHNEIMQNALRSGIFGLISSLMMFCVPAVVFYRGSFSKVPSVRAAGLVGLCYIVAVFCFGLSTETFNLKYTISFYALMVATLAAQVLRPQPS